MRHRLGHQRGHFGDVPRLGEGVHLDELQEIAGIFAADQAVQRQAHALDVDVLAVVTHRAAHVEQHRRGALGIVARLVDDDVFGLEPDRQARSVAQQGVGERGRDVHVRHGIAELVGPGLLHLGGAFADDRALMPAGARRLQLLEDARQQLGLKQPIGVRRHLKAAAFAFLESLLLGHLPQIFLNLLLQGVELLHLPRFGELGQFLHVDDADLRRLGRLFQLLEQLVDRFQFVLDLQRFGNRHRLVAGEFVLRRPAHRPDISRRAARSNAKAGGQTRRARRRCGTRVFPGRRSARPGPLREMAWPIWRAASFART